MQTQKVRGFQGDFKNNVSYRRDGQNLCVRTVDSYRPLLRESEAAHDNFEKGTVEFLFIAESGFLEEQCLLLCESLRKFGGRYARAKITVLQPRREKPISPEGRGQLEGLKARVVEMAIVSPCPEYGTSYRVFSCAEYERSSSADWLVFMDSDTVLLAEPDLEPGGADVAARPVDVKGMCTSGEGDRNEPYWRKLCQVCGVDYDLIPYVTTTVERTRVRASYNGGLTVVRTKAGLFGKAADFFLRSLRANLVPWPDRTCTFATGHGTVSAEGSRLWGSSQASLSLAITALGLSVRTLPASLNFPLHLYSELLPELKKGTLPPVSHVHYHHLFRGPANQNPLFAGMLQVPVASLAWLWQRLEEGTRGDAYVNSAKRLIVVLGMPGSGTGILSKGLQALGADLGPDLIPPCPRNSAGSGVDPGFGNLNEELLKALNCPWDGFAEAETLLQRTRGSLFFCALKLVRQRMRGKTLVGINDLRFSVLLPFWQKVFEAAGVPVFYVLPFRCPWSVADSLLDRKDMTKARLLRLWLIYHTHVVAHTSGVPLVVVDHNELVDAPALQLARVARILGLPVDRDAPTVFSSGLLDPSLRPTRYSDDEIGPDPACDPMVSEVYAALRTQALASSAPDPDLWRRLASKWQSSLRRREGLPNFSSASVAEN